MVKNLRAAYNGCSCSQAPKPKRQGEGSTAIPHEGPCLGKARPTGVRLNRYEWVKSP